MKCDENYIKKFSEALSEEMEISTQSLKLSILSKMRKDDLDYNDEGED